MSEPENIIHQGQVSSYNEKNHTARVAFDDWEGLVSGELQIIQPGVTQMRVKAPLQVGDHVACLFQANGIQEGYIIGSPYTGSNMPDGTDGETFLVYFPGKEIRMTVNAATGEIVVDAPQSEVTVKCKSSDVTASEGVKVTCKTANVSASNNITESAPTINLNGVISMSDQSGSGSTTATINGTVRVQGDVIVNGISFIGHRHEGVHGTTSPPF